MERDEMQSERRANAGRCSCFSTQDIRMGKCRRRKRVGMWAGREMARNEGDKQTGGGEGRVERKMEGRRGETCS